MFEVVRIFKSVIENPVQAGMWEKNDACEFKIKIAHKPSRQNQQDRNAAMVEHII